MKTQNDTIAAIATPLGEGGIGIVRISGPRALSVAQDLFHASSGKSISAFPSGTMHHGFIKVPGTGEVIDEVMVAVLKAPGTYTREDVVEINCHGGIMPLKKTMGLLISRGARVAEPGEFTKRAFLSGRIDLAQAEAVLDIINSETEASNRIAIDQLKGVFSSEIKEIRSDILDILSSIELTIDFSQEDVEFPRVKELAGRLDDACRKIGTLISTFDKGMILRQGASVVICGRPNVGKSSLMNALLRHERVIVTPVAGTTRDVIEESININGIKVRISDTAGIIETRDRVELEGIKRSRKKLEEADVVIFMVDASRELSSRDEEIFEAIRQKRTVLVANKTDLPVKVSGKDLEERFGERMLGVSVLKNEGLEMVEDAVSEKLFGGDNSIPQGAVVSNLRHKELLDLASAGLERARRRFEEGFNGELLASDLNEAVHHLGLITGETVEDDILDRIFSEFCIGK